MSMAYEPHKMGSVHHAKRYVLVVDDESAQDEGVMELLQQLVCFPAAIAGLATAAAAEGLAQAIDKEVGCVCVHIVLCGRKC